MTGDASTDPDDLLRQADIAMYEAKVSGRNGFCVFNGDLPARALAHCDLAAAIRKAIDNSEFFVLYQPFFSLGDRSLCGAEALVRWRHPERGVLAPEDFLPLAGRRGLVDAIDSFVLDEACRQLSRWAHEGPCMDRLSVAVSLAGGQLSDPALVERVATTINRHDLVPSRLCLQITEAGLMSETRGAATVLSALSDLGVRLALGHAGTAYAVLAHAQRLNVDILKLDRSFVEQIGGGLDQKVIEAIVAMARALGMSVVCDGIAADRQLDVLTVLGCDEGQGFLWAPPLPPELVAVLGRSLATP
jgi:EAL domain-containing protein (putative c-di-GMP-specific phosphodiesterase class I)